MKNNLFIPAVIACLFFITSCEKKEHEDTVISKVINVDLKQNESYSYTIPAGDDAMQISQQAQHALISRVTTDVSRNTRLEYTPAIDYTGSDEIHVGIIESGHNGNGGGHHHGNCQGGGNETETRYIFKINITPVSATDPH